MIVKLVCQCITFLLSTKSGISGMDSTVYSQINHLVGIYPLKFLICSVNDFSLILLDAHQSLIFI